MNELRVRRRHAECMLRRCVAGENRRTGAIRPSDGLDLLARGGKRAPARCERQHATRSGAHPPCPSLDPQRCRWCVCQHVALDEKLLAPLVSACGAWYDESSERQIVQFTVRCDDEPLYALKMRLEGRDK